MEGKRNYAYKAIRKLGNRPGEPWNKAEINLPAHKEHNLTPLQAANKLATYFSSISQTVEPLDESKFPPALPGPTEGERRDKTNFGGAWCV